MIQSPAQTVMICCSVFRPEVEHLHQTNWLEVDIEYQNSMMHMRPQVLAEHLEKLTAEKVANGQQVVLIYGDCCMAMAGLEARPGIVRTRGNNCCQMLLGNDEYRRLSHEGVFFLLPEWTHRWREIFTQHLGLTPDNAADLMGDMHRKFVYLDTGIMPVPTDALRQCAEYCGLRHEIKRISLETLRGSIDQALSRLHVPGKPI